MNGPAGIPLPPLDLTGGHSATGPVQFGGIYFTPRPATPADNTRTLLLVGAAVLAFMIWKR